MANNVYMKKNPKAGYSKKKNGGLESSYLFVLCTAGSFEYVLNGTVREVKARSFVYVPSSTVLESATPDAEFKGYVAMLTQDYVHSLHISLSNVLIWDKMFDVHVVPVSRRQCDSIRIFMETMLSCWKDSENPDSDEAMWHLSKAFVYKSLQLFATGEVPRDDASVFDRKSQIVNEFLALVQEHGSQQRSLEFYASEMCISPKYLSFVVSRCTGRKALAWIEEYAINRACSMLKSTDLSINQIAEALSFSSPSDFCRYFRKRTGKTPRSFRMDK